MGEKENKGKSREKKERAEERPCITMTEESQPGGKKASVGRRESFKEGVSVYV